MKANKTIYHYVCENCELIFEREDKRRYKYCSPDCGNARRRWREKNKFVKKRSDLRKKFNRFHENNPKVYESILIIARNLITEGHEHYGMKAIIEKLRWFHTGRISNNYASFYARMIMAQEKDLNGFFKIRGEKK